jgi:hypothetical protein
MPWDDEQRGVAGFMVLAATLGAVVLIGGRTAKYPPDSSFLKKKQKTFPLINHPTRACTRHCFSAGFV